MNATNGKKNLSRVVVIPSPLLDGWKRNKILDEFLWDYEYE
jgi:hypothetical protein